MNLVDIDEAASSAHVGFSVGEDDAGQGLASEATKRLLEKITDAGITHVHNEDEYCFTVSWSEMDSTRLPEMMTKHLT